MRVFNNDIIYRNSGYDCDNCAELSVTGSVYQKQRSKETPHQLLHGVANSGRLVQWTDSTHDQCRPDLGRKK